MKNIDRLKRLKHDAMKRKGSFIKDFNPFIRDCAMWSAHKKEFTPVTRRAALLLELVKAAPIDIYKGWSLAGEHLLKDVNFQTIPGHAAEQDKDKRRKYLSQLNLNEDKIKSMHEEIKSGHYSPYHGPANKYTEGAYTNWDFVGTDKVFCGRGWMENHSIRDYSLLIKSGWGGLLKKIRERLSSVSIEAPDAGRQLDFLHAVEYVCEAGILLGKRYSKKAGELASATKDPAEKQRLEYMAENCANIAENGAKSFRDAVQMLWLGHILTCGEDGINANSIGRLDQFLYPYFQSDYERGRISRDEALELMEELACKLYLDYDVQTITLGGLDSDGNNAVNDLSYIILEATKNLSFIRALSVRTDRNTPEKFIDAASELIIKGGGIPFVFNDEVFVKALSDRGIAIEDARNYAPIGCVELTIPGKANPHAVSGWFNTAKCLELALNNGKDPGTGRQIGPKTGELESFKSFEALYAAYTKQVRFFAERMVLHCNQGELAQQQNGPLPCWSLLTDNCIERGHDITDGGALYNYHSICFMGAPDTADSLFALKKTLFDDHSLKVEEIKKALKDNFKGHEKIRQLLKSLPKYGNDNKEVDEITSRVCNDFISLMDEMRSPLNGRYFVHLFTFKLNINFGKAVGAMPDGSFAGEPLAYSLSAHQGCDKEGLTSMLKSLSRQPHSMAAGGSAAIIDIHPSILNGESGIKLLSSIIQAGLKMGIGQLQWNVVSAERLEQAKKEPELYGNIPVRVAGYSQLFNLVEPELQEHIIARTKHQNA